MNEGKVIAIYKQSKGCKYPITDLGHVPTPARPDFSIRATACRQEIV